jgi:[ribosomal protein S5]-alanine N-acetyltransferase
MTGSPRPIPVSPTDVGASLPALETSRLVLRRMRESDADDVFAYASDPAVAEHTSWEPHASIEESRVFAARMARSTGCSWAIEHKAHLKLIGTIGYQPRIVPGVRGEISFALSRHYWGQGLMTEALTEVIHFGFAVLGLNRIEARCKVENAASARVMEKSGMTFEGILRETSFSKGRFLDLKMYSILRREWHATTPR